MSEYRFITMSNFDRLAKINPENYKRDICARNTITSLGVSVARNCKLNIADLSKKGLENFPAKKTKDCTKTCRNAMGKNQHFYKQDDSPT